MVLRGDVAEVWMDSGGVKYAREHQCQTTVEPPNRVGWQELGMESFCPEVMIRAVDEARGAWDLAESSGGWGSAAVDSCRGPSVLWVPLAAAASGGPPGGGWTRNRSESAGVPNGVQTAGRLPAVYRFGRFRGRTP